MGTTARQDEEFIREVIARDLLEQSMGWIAANLNPEDVFSEKELRAWALESGFVEEAK